MKKKTLASWLESLYVHLLESPSDNSTNFSRKISTPTKIMSFYTKERSREMNIISSSFWSQGGLKKILNFPFSSIERPSFWGINKFKKKLNFTLNNLFLYFNGESKRRIRTKYQIRYTSSNFNWISIVSHQQK